jgi:hypothetical protein
MTTQQLRAEINKFLDKVPEAVLKDVLDFLEEAQTKTKRQIDLSRNLRKILREDKDLLQKLAQ